MTEVYHVLFENAHNEYLQYLLTNGILGTLSYSAFLASSFLYVTKRRINNIPIMAMLTGVFCYAVQGIVNISQPIVTPVMWTLLAMSMAGAWQKEETEETNIENDRQESSERTAEA